MEDFDPPTMEKLADGSQATTQQVAAYKKVLSKLEEHGFDLSDDNSLSHLLIPIVLKSPNLQNAAQGFCETFDVLARYKNLYRRTIEGIFQAEQKEPGLALSFATAIQGLEAKAPINRVILRDLCKIATGPDGKDVLNQLICELPTIGSQYFFCLPKKFGYIIKEISEMQPSPDRAFDCFSVIHSYLDRPNAETHRFRPELLSNIAEDFRRMSASFKRNSEVSSQRQAA